jgi:peptidoglycan/LPS O-acetylase OafA/YrhL
MKLNEGVFPKHPARIFLERYLRILPLYFFMIFFLWKFISLLGGDGPRFY